MLKIIRQAMVFIIGMMVVLAGIVMLVLPGPGILLIIAGLTILAVEFEWAKRHQTRLKTYIRKLTKKVR